MNTSHSTLWQNVQSFDFDAPEATHRFSDRLSKDNGWTAPFAARAIEEYRRFAFLAVAAGHPVSPSDAVDQVWHLHLLYTRSYWERFCVQILGRPLHHEPSTGGGKEVAKFEDWYGQTIESYRSFFGEPPADLWPQGAAKLGRDERYRRVNLADHWLLPRRRVLAVAQAVAVAAALFALIALIGGCQSATGQTQYNPLEFRGPDFLAFYAAAFLGALLVVALLRLKAKEGDEQAVLTARLQQPAALDAYDIAYLAGGPARVAMAAASSLCQRGLVTVRGRGFHRTPAARIPAGIALHPVEQAVWESIEAVDPCTLLQLGRRSRVALAKPMGRLTALNFILSEGSARRVWWLSLAVLLATPLVGIAKICVGISRGRPVGFLVVGCLLSAIVTIWICALRPLRTRRGDAALRKLRNRNHANLKRASGPTEIANAVALLGVGALVGMEWSALRQALEPVSDTGGDNSSGCSSGDSGGSSGCGGGGCGGCGG